MTHYLIDASAWIEYFLATEKGKKVKNLIEAKGVVLSTSESTIAELFNYCIKRNHDFNTALITITQKSTLREVYLNIWIEAANHRAHIRANNPKFGLIDAINVALQRAHSAIIITADRDFRGVPNAIIL